MSDDSEYAGLLTFDPGHPVVLTLGEFGPVVGLAFSWSAATLVEGELPAGERWLVVAHIEGSTQRVARFPEGVPPLPPVVGDNGGYRLVARELVDADGPFGAWIKMFPCDRKLDASRISELTEQAASSLREFANGDPPPPQAPSVLQLRRIDASNFTKAEHFPGGGYVDWEVFRGICPVGAIRQPKTTPNPDVLHLYQYFLNNQSVGPGAGQVVRPGSAVPSNGYWVRIDYAISNYP